MKPSAQDNAAWVRRRLGATAFDTERDALAVLEFLQQLEQERTQEAWLSP